MISKQELNKIAMHTGLPLYQQEKDYFLMLFLYFYYKRFDTALFKGGTCLRYLFNIGRFSEDLDFNTKFPQQFQKQVRETAQQFTSIGIQAYFRKEELFSDAYTCEIGVLGPLSDGRKQTENKFRIDAGYRTGTFEKPTWKMIKSPYPETTAQYLVLTMDVQELFVEKLLALFNRNKGRDLYDVWYLLQSGVVFDALLFEKKRKKEKISLKKVTFLSKAVYERDMKQLSSHLIPYEQVEKEVRAFLVREKIL
ncbi:MAG: nucleotidyl transferase AbiEii/AbiGii toxin family protein [Nanoarchaeota archaeon]